MSTASSAPADAVPPSPITTVTLRRDTRQPRLPAPVDTLYGRDVEIAEIAEALHSRSSRLLVLTGPGGVGKTRLAIASASAAAASFADGVVFVELAPVRDPALVAATIAQPAGIRESGGQPASVRLAEVLAERELLLVLDNFEHLLPAGDVVSELLAACPRLVTLMTSRTRPRLTGERDIPVQPLQLPGQSTPSSARQRTQPTTAPEPVDLDVGTIERSPAVHLFADRARAIDPSFRLSNDTAYAVAEICRRVDGLPLAIELAAARTQVLPPAALLARLETRLPLLAGGPQDQPARLRTMRQAIAWSYDLLPAEEQAAFQCLAVFVGGFGLDAAQAVCAAPLEQVAALVDQSLLLKMPSDAEPRCAMLETIREFGLERLARGAAETLVRDRHAAWCLELATTREPDLYGGRGQVAALRRLEEELPNFRIAFARLLETGHHEAALRLAVALVRLMHTHGHLVEGREWLETALARTPEAPAPLRAWALLALGMLAFNQLDYGRAAEVLDEALPLVTTGADPRGLAFARVVQTVLALAHGRFAEMAAFAAESEAIAAAIDNRWDVHLARFLRAKAELYAGNLETAEALNRDLIAAARDEEMYVTSAARLDGATIRQLRGDHAGALALLAHALRTFHELGELWDSAMALERAAAAAVGLGHAERAVSLLGTAEVLRASMGTPVLPPDRPAYDRTIATARELLGDSRFAEAWAAGQAATLDEAIACTSELAAEAGTGKDTQGLSKPIAATRLTPREREVLALLVAGQSDPQIGVSLSISARTVESHVAAILAKLEMPSRTAAVAYAVRHDLV